MKRKDAKMEQVKIANKAKTTPRKKRIFRRGAKSAAAPDPAMPIAVPCCSNCGVPILDAYKALQWEQRLVGHLIERHEALKQSLSDEIFESFSQQLAGALLHLQGYEEKQKANFKEVGELFSSGLRLLQGVLAESRRIANRLKPPILNNFGLREGIDHLEERGGHDNLEIEFLPSGNLHRISAPVINAAFRIIQELLDIARDQSGRHKIRLKMIGTDRFLRIDIANWGDGFDPEKRTETHFRLQKIRQRVHRQGGLTALRRTTGQGMQLIIDLPCSQVE